MSCNCNNANKNCEPCAFCTPPGVTGLTTCQPIDPCEEKPNVDCVYYNGPDAECLGIHQGDSLTFVLQSILEYYIAPVDGCCDLDGIAEFVTTTTSTSTSTTTSSTTTTTTLPPDCSYYAVNNAGPRYPGAVIEYYPCNCIYPQQSTITDTAITICVDNDHPITVISGTIQTPIDYGPCTLEPCPTTTTTTEPPCNCKIYTVQNLSHSYSYDLEYIDCSLGVPGITTNLSVAPSTTITICACDTLEEVSNAFVIITNTEDDCEGPITTTTTTIDCTNNGATGQLMESFTMVADKVTEIKFHLIQSSTDFVINFGAGLGLVTYPAGSYYHSINCFYTTPYSGNITFYSTDLTGIVGFYDADYSGAPSAPGWPGFNCLSGGSLSVTTLELNKLDGCLTLELLNTKTTGDIAYLPASLEAIALWGNGRPGSASCANTVTGNIINMPPNAWSINILGQNTLTGDIDDLPTPSLITSNGYYIAVNGLNTIWGNISNLPTGAPGIDNVVRINGNNTITGNIIGLPTDYKVFEIGGGPDSNHGDAYGNTVYGNLSNFPSQLDEFILKGDNMISGDLADIYAPNLNVFYLRGKATIVGDIGDMYAPNLLSLTLIDDLSLTTITGDIGTFGSSLFPSLQTLQIVGSQSIYGTIAGLPTTLVNFIVRSANSSLTGAWYNINTFTVLRQFINSLGSSNISGDLADLPSSIKVFSYDTTNTTSVATCTPGHIWANPMQMFNYTTGTAMTTTNINNLLVSLAGVPSWAVMPGAYSSGKTVKLKGVATGAGLTAITTLTTNGVTVTIIP